jgi:hypothetical protein
MCCPYPRQGAGQTCSPHAGGPVPSGLPPLPLDGLEWAEASAGQVILMMEPLALSSFARLPHASVMLASATAGERVREVAGGFRTAPSRQKRARTVPAVDEVRLAALVAHSHGPATCVGHAEPVRWDVPTVRRLHARPEGLGRQHTDSVTPSAQPHSARNLRSVIRALMLTCEEGRPLDGRVDEDVSAWEWGVTPAQLATIRRVMRGIALNAPPSVKRKRPLVAALLMPIWARLCPDIRTAPWVDLRDRVWQGVMHDGCLRVIRMEGVRLALGDILFLGEAGIPLGMRLTSGTPRRTTPRPQRVERSTPSSAAGSDSRRMWYRRR